jgi:putative transposase
MITKTLTFGLGTMLGFNKKNNELIELTDEHRKKIYVNIRQGFYDFARLCNFFTARLYSEKILKIDFKKHGYNTGYKQIEDKLGLDTPLNGLVKNQAWILSKSHFAGKHGKSLMGKGESVLPTHKANGSHPLCFHHDGVELIKSDKTYYILYSIFSDKWCKAEELPSWVAFKINIKPRDKSGASQIEKILSEEWGKGSGQLIRNNRRKGPKYLMHLVVKYEPNPYKELSADTVMGIDRGVNAPASIHLRTNGEPLKWAMNIGDGRLMLNARGLIRNEIKRLLRGLKRKDSPIQGPARASAMKRLKELRGKEQRIMKTANQKNAAQIATLAKRHGAGVWQIEELGKGIKEDSWLARNWAPGMFLDSIRWQAKQLGVELMFVNPAYTSQRCSKCGNINKKNRPKGKDKAAKFECTVCGYKDHADKNAARNLSDLEIEEKIKLSIDNKMIPNGIGGV